MVKRISDLRMCILAGGTVKSSGFPVCLSRSTCSRVLRLKSVGVRLDDWRQRSTMPTTLESVVANYLRSGNPAQRTREEYATTLRKWSRWSGAVPLENLGKKEIREFLDWVQQDAAGRHGSNPGRTANKVRSHLRAVLSWAWEHDLVDALPRFPKLKPQRDVAGRHYLTKPEINSLYFATHQMSRPRGWSERWPVGRYWRCALVVFFN